MKVNLVGKAILIKKIEVETRQQKQNKKIELIKKENIKDEKELITVYDEMPSQGEVVALGNDYSGSIKVGDKIAMKLQSHLESFVYGSQLYFTVNEFDVIAVYTDDKR